MWNRRRDLRSGAAARPLDCECPLLTARPGTTWETFLTHIPIPAPPPKGPLAAGSCDHHQLAFCFSSPILFHLRAPSGLWRSPPSTAEETGFGGSEQLPRVPQLIVVIESLSHVQLFATPWTAARQASLSFTVSQSLLAFMPIESVMPSNCLILCCPLLLLPSVFPSIRVFFNELALHIRWPKC